MAGEDARVIESSAYAALIPSAADRAKVRAAIVVHDDGPPAGVVEGRLDGAPFLIDLMGHGLVSGTGATAAHVVATAGATPIVWVEADQVHVAFDWFAWEHDVLAEVNLPGEQPVHSRQLIPYTRIPFALRSQMNRARIALLAARNRDQRFPVGPVDTSLDRLRSAIWSAAAACVGVTVETPASRRVMLTHDVDEEFGFPGIEMLRGVEREFEMVSAFGFLSKRYTAPQSLLTGLVEEGCEVFSHGYLHDGTLPFLDHDELMFRLRHFFEVYPAMVGHTRGFRAGQLVRGEPMYKAVAEIFEYDLTPPNVEMGGPHGWRTGCASTHPFTRPSGLVHVPVTVPQDYFVSYIEGLSEDRMVDAWIDATETVWSVGGIAVQIVHPDNVRRRPRILKAYRRYLDALARRGAQVILPADAANGEPARPGAR